MPSPCPDENLFLDLAAGRLSEDESRALTKHIDLCPACQSLAAVAVCSLSPGGFSPALPVYAAQPSACAESGPELEPLSLLAPGTQVGRYVIEHLLGSGGMGIVYAARDPRLDRRVAIKLLRPQRSFARAELPLLLLSESQALARLSHRNVTAVHDIGNSEHGIYVALEFVDGVTLRQWLAERPRSARETLRVFLEAGEGLAAAHRAGLVHRDFKPDNVMVGRDGSVRVTDFGLACLQSTREAGASPNASAEMPSGVPRTRVGTPAYMAPEQRSGASVDARADQFSFSVALWEALFGSLPDASAGAALAKSAFRSPDIRKPRAARVSKRARSALCRGLAPSPAERFPSLDELLRELAPRSGRPLYAALAGVLAACLVLLASYVIFVRDAELCSGALQQAAEVWNAARRDRIRAAFAASRARNADATWLAVEEDISHGVQAWITQRTEACAAVRLRGEQSEVMLDLRTGCFERRRAELDSLLAVFESADAETVRNARAAVAQTIELASCSDIEGLAQTAPQPRDAAARAQLAAASKKVADARAQGEVAHYVEARPLAAAALAAAQSVAYAPLVAEAQYVRAKIEARLGDFAQAEEALFASICAGEAGRAPASVARAAVELAFLFAEPLPRPREAQRWIDFAAAMIVAKGGDALLESHLADVTGIVLQREGKVAEAEQSIRHAVALAEKAAPQGREHGEALTTLGTYLARRGRFAEARPVLERALALHRRNYGVEHSITANTEMNLANVLASLGSNAEAVTLLRSALATKEATAGADSPDVATVLLNLGTAEQRLGHFREAHAAFARCLELREKHPEQPDRLANSERSFGFLLLDEGRTTEALTHFTRAGAIIDKAHGAGHAERAEDLYGAGRVYLARGESAPAAAALERALGLLQSPAADPLLLARIESALGRALIGAGRDRSRAARLLDHAYKVLAEAGEEKEAQEIEDFRRRSPG